LSEEINGVGSDCAKASSGNIAGKQRRGVGRRLEDLLFRIGSADYENIYHHALEEVTYERVVNQGDTEQQACAINTVLIATL
jgi:hypothetical protein